MWVGTNVADIISDPFLLTIRSCVVPRGARFAFPVLVDPMRLPSLKFLKTFQVAARVQSFKAAAEELFVTPSAMRRLVRLDPMSAVVLAVATHGGPRARGLAGVDAVDFEQGPGCMNGAALASQNCAR